ncbi:MAG: hypothetical protein RL532_1110 [Actinomycetota bacterium]
MSAAAVSLSLDLLEPYKFGFFGRGLVAATLAGALCGVLGVYVVHCAECSAYTWYCAG